MLLHGVNKIELVCDPFNGLGSSALAANALGLNFVGYDIDRYYCEQARARLEVGL